jgi:TPR repeat protein
VNADDHFLARERILERPTSPELMAWDNPFPTFNPKKKTNRKNHSSLDKDIGNLGLHQTNSPEARPHTSQGTRSRADSRPSTAHGYRQPDRDPLPSSPLPQQQPRMSPLRRDPPKGYNRDYDSDGQQGHYGHTMGPVRPGLNPQHPNAYEQTTNSLRNQAFSGLEQPVQPVQRSMTMPENVSPSEYQRKAPNPSAAKPYWPEREGPSHSSGQRVRPQPSPHVDYGQFGPVATRSRSNEVGQPAVQDARLYQGQYTDHQVHQRQNPHEQTFPRIDRSKISREADLPRFDAIAAPPSEKFEDHLQTVRDQNLPQPAYTKKAYQPPQQAREQPLQIQDQRNVNQGDQTPQSPFAEFQFDLPRNQQNMPEGQHASTRQRPFPVQNMPQQPSAGSRQYEQYQQQYGYEDARQPAQNQGPTDHFPPRKVSRMQPQPRSASDAHQYPPQEAQLRQERSFSDTQQPPLNNHDRSYDRARPDAHQPGEAGYDPPSFASRGQPSSSHSYRGVNDQQYGGETRPGRLQADFTGESNEYDAAQTLPTGISMHPPPVRHYDQRGASGPSPGPPNRPSGPRSPDSLPMHPTPVRPGLMNNGADVPRSSQDGRGQQLPRTAAPQQSVAPKTTATPSSIDVKQKPPPVTLQELGLLQQQVRTNPSDHATALKLAKKLVEAVSVLANEDGRADAKTTANNREKYVFDAHKLLKKLVSAGYPDAMFYLADCHGQGKLGLEVDPREAFSLYQSAAKLNHAQSAYRVAVCCEMGAEEGGGTRRDPLKAMQWYKRAATLGDAAAMYKMGMIQLKGLLGQPKNPREALSWLKRAAERADEDNPHALHELGLLYESAAPNDAIIRDENYSRQLFTQAAELGYKYSQFRLGSAYEYGMLGCLVDARQSIAWYSRAAAQGEHQSELALSGWYLTGSEGLIQQSDTEAYLWARKAASSGLAKAEYAMGYFTEVGIGAPGNLEEAKRWYWRAACELRENALMFNEFDY